MEIEAKFKVPDSSAAQQLARLNAIGAFTLGAPTRYTMRDTYFDTRANDLLAERIVLRVRRRSDGRMFLTLKTPATRQGAVHSRPEIETSLNLSRTPRVLHPSELPAQIKAVVTPRAADRALYPMFSITQRRDVRTVRHARRVIAEWSLDLVKFRAGVRKHSFHELEIELKKTGTPAELSALADWLEHTYHLHPATESKFARALTFMRA